MSNTRVVSKASWSAKSDRVGGKGGEDGAENGVGPVPLPRPGDGRPFDMADGERPAETDVGAVSRENRSFPVSPPENLSLLGMDEGAEM